MIDQKYLELINRDIDDTVSTAEKEVLYAYLKINPEAYNMHQDLIEVEKLLDKLPDSDPSDSLKQRILNSINFNLYNKKEKTIKDYFFASFSGPRRKLTASFALGMVTGILFLSIIFYASFHNNFTEENNVLGTIGLSKSYVLESVDVNTPEIAGKIDVIKAADQYAIYVNLKSSGEYSLQVELDQEYFKIDNAGTEWNNNSPYSLLFSAKETSPQKLSLTISGEDRKQLFQREISLSNR